MIEKIMFRRPANSMDNFYPHLIISNLEGKLSTVVEHATTKSGRRLRWFWWISSENKTTKLRLPVHQAEDALDRLPWYNPVACYRAKTTIGLKIIFAFSSQVNAGKLSFTLYCWLYQSSSNHGKALAGHFKAGCKGEIHQVETEIHQVETEIHQVETEIS